MLMTALQSGLKPREQRVKVVVPCRVNVAGSWSDACIHNVSSRGLLVAGSTAAPAVGTYVDIRRGSIVMIGRVMWGKERFYGVRVQDRISASQLVAEPRGRRKTRRDGGDARSASDRALIHEGNVARRVERSRAFAAAFQASLLVTAGGAAAVFVAMEVYESLSTPMEALKVAMGGG